MAAQSAALCRGSLLTTGGLSGGENANFAAYQGLRKIPLGRQTARRAVKCGARPVVVARFGNDKASNDKPKKAGTQLFRFGGKKEEDEEPVEKPKRAGTQFFRLGGKKEEDEEPVKKAGTAIFRLGGRKIEEKEPEPKRQGGTIQFKLGGGKKPQDGALGGTIKKSASFLSFLTKKPRVLDPKVAFVVGATGQTGSRVVKELLKAGFTVRAGVTNVEEGNQLLAFASRYEVISKEEAGRLRIVQAELSFEDAIAEAIGNSSKVVLTLGPGENGPGGKVTTNDALRVVEAIEGSSAHFVLVAPKGGVAASGGGGLGGFFGNLFGGGGAAVSSKGLIQKLAEKDLKYTVLETGPTTVSDDYTFESNLVVGVEGSGSASAQVSKCQVAQLVAGVLRNEELSAKKVLEVSASPEAPVKSMEELLSCVSEDRRVAIIAEQRAAAEAAEQERQRQKEAAEEAARIRAEAQAAAAEAAAEAREAAAEQARLEAEARQIAAVQAKAGTRKMKANQEVEVAQRTIKLVADKADRLGGLSALPKNGRPAKQPALAFNPFQAAPKAAKAPEPEPEPKKAEKPGFSFGPFAPKVPEAPKAADVKAAAKSAAAETKKGLGGFSFGSLAAKVPDAKEVKGAAKEVAGEAKKSAFSFGSALKATPTPKPAPTPVKRAAAPAKPTRSAPEPPAQSKPAKKGGVGTLFGKVKEEEYIYED